MTLRTMSTRMADKAIASGQPVTVTPKEYGSPFALTIQSRDKRMVRGTYLWENETLQGTFERKDLLVEC